jgi:tetratricopeptide (TPR) repeat protein
MILTEGKTHMRTLLTAALASAALGLTAQNVNVVNAYNHMKSDELAKASEFIEMATQDAKTGVSEKTWRYRGEIYYRIFTGEDEALKAQFPDAAKQAITSYVKANEYDTKGSYRKENDRALRMLQGLSLNAGNEAFGAKEYDKAISLYANSEQVARVFGEADTNAIFNSALAFDSKGDTDNAVRRYREAIDAGYQAPEVYRYISGIQRKNDDLETAIATTKEGMVRFPDNKDLILDLMSYLLLAQRSEEAEGIVQLALEKDPGNAVLYSVLGGLYDKKASEAADAKNEADMYKWYDKAEEAYKSSIEKDAAFFDAYFNIGVLYNNRAAYEYEKCNQIKSDTEYMKCKGKADDVYLKAVPYFEQAHAQRPDDVQTIQQLMKLYAKTNDQAKYQVMKDKLPK